jgi:sugar lactone lactonase YvrE
LDDGNHDRGDNAPTDHFLNLSASVSFPVMPFIGYWAALNIVGYSIAGEKMPWLTTHLTVPMILLAGWLVGRTIDRVNWKRVWADNNWLLLILLPIFVIGLGRVLGPLCASTPALLICNTIIPESYQGGIFTGMTIDSLRSTYSWLAAVLVMLGLSVLLARYIPRLPFTDVGRLSGLLVVATLTLMTVRTSWLASYINYDYANEFLVYAHSSGSVKDVLDQLEEMSLKTTDGYGIKVAYDNRVSWPMSWYLRGYYNAIYFGEEPSRGLIGDSPVIFAGPSNWDGVERLLGNRYYRFEYIRMWWPTEEYRGVTGQTFTDIFNDPLLQRGLWDIFTRRDYSTYSEAIKTYRTGPNLPTFLLSEWSPAERMRVYIRKDMFAQVWDYGVAPSEIVEAIDPYSQNVQNLQPSATFGGEILNRPHGMSIGPDGDLYVADTNGYRIVVFDAQGNFVQEMGGFGLAPQSGVLNEPWDVSVDADGSVYVADTWNHRIVKFDSDGKFVTQWGEEGIRDLTNPNGFWGPRGIVVDDNGNVYLADTGNKRIQVFDSNGVFVRQIGDGGSGIAQLDEPVGLAVGPNDILYVADTWNQRIQVFTVGGLFIREWSIDAWFAQTNERPYLDVDALGQVYVTDPEGFRIIVFNSEGQYRYSFGDFDIFTVAGAVAVADDGNTLYVADTEAGVIKQFDLTTLNQTIPVGPSN